MPHAGVSLGLQGWQCAGDGEAATAASHAQKASGRATRDALPQYCRVCQHRNPFDRREMKIKRRLK